jgi:hypothetical protein
MPESKHQGRVSITDSVRQIALSATEVLRRLDVGGLSLRDSTLPRGKSPAPSERVDPHGGFDPYSKGTTSRRGGPNASASRARPGEAPRRSWWRGLFVRR